MCYKKILPLFIAPERFHTSTVATEVVATVGHREDTGGKKKCVCSPWKHPRSFKCPYQDIAKRGGSVRVVSAHGLDSWLYLLINKGRVAEDKRNSE
ncbi:unnamed protein product [Brassica oleracea var. botrytis]